MALEDTDLEDLVDYCLLQKRDGVDYTLLRNKLRSKGLDHDTIEVVLRECDNRYLEEIKPGERQPGILDRFRPIVARFLIYTGILVTVFSLVAPEFFGGFMVIWYGPVLAGLGMLTSRRGRRFFNKSPFFQSSIRRWRDD